MKTHTQTIIYFLTVVILITAITACSSDAPTNNKHEIEVVKSAHYFSSAWPKTFWQEFEEADVLPELKQIKDDGFNTIILTVPWRGFETQFQDRSTQSNEFLYERLKFVLAKIQESDLFYMLRVGFPHDYTPDTGTDIATQCKGIYTDEKMQGHWRNYLHKIKQVTRKFKQYSVGTIVSWEDFWCPHFVFPNLSQEERLSLAQQMKYGDWLKSKSMNIVKVMLKENDLKYDQVYIPQPGDLSYVLYLEFIDEMLDKQVLQPLKSVFTDAAMEVRVDKLPIKQEDHYTWIGHNLYLNEPNHRGSYWAPFWGAENKGELLSAETALKNFEYFLNVITHNGENTNHVIEQFNFYDNTPYFPNNANIKPDEIDDFLSGATPLLKKFSQGFGVWAYKDYQDNALYNSSFELGTTGWMLLGNTKIIKQKGSQYIKFNKGASVSQKIPAHERMMFVSAYKKLDLCLVSNSASELEISVTNNPAISWSLTQGKNCTQIPVKPFQENELTNFSLKAKSTVEIDEIKLSGFTQKLGLYDANGNPGQNLDAYRKLNQEILLPIEPGPAE